MAIINAGSLPMNHRSRRISSAMALALCLGIAFVPFGCASSVDSAPLKNAEVIEGPHVPNGTVARLRECVEEFGSELPGSGYEFHYKVKVDAEGRVVDVTTDVPHADLAGCTRSALRAMPVPEEVFRKLVLSEPLARANEQTGAARGLVGNVVLLGAAIALAEVVIEAGGVTVIAEVAILIVAAEIDAVTRRPTNKNSEKERCKRVKQMCIDECTATLPTPDYGAKFFKCKNECLERHCCPRDS